MRIRFFGDSWAWTWFTELKKSNYKNILSLDNEYETGISLIKILFDASDHECTIHNEPGTGPKHTKDVIKNQISLARQANEEEYWIWQISCTLRNDTYDSFDFSSLNKFINSYDARILEHLQEINDFGIPDNIHICLIGCHSTLPKHIFDSIENRSNNIHFMCKNFIQEVSTVEHGLTYDTNNKNKLIDRFRLSSPKFFFEYVEPFGDDYMDYFDKEVLEFFTECADHGHHNVNETVTWPDSGHLGFSGHVLLFEYVLNFIKELQSRNENFD